MLEQDPQRTIIDAVVRAETAEAELKRLRETLAAEVSASDRKAAQKMSMLRIIFSGISALMCFLGVLTFVNWYIPGTIDKDGIGASYFQMSKDIILVMTGILGSAMANVFDGRSGSRSSDKPADPS
jgi:hypothetical protein